MSSPQVSCDPFEFDQRFVKPESDQHQQLQRLCPNSELYLDILSYLDKCVESLKQRGEHFKNVPAT